MDLFSSCVLFVTILAASVIGQTLLVAGFVARLRRGVGGREGERPATGDAAPRVRVVLCLRGADPFLPQCISALLNQDYANFDILVLIDHPEDPSREVVEALVRGSGGRISIEFLAEHRETCSLKCSSLVQAIDHLDPEVGVLALVDADVVTHRTWLSELVGALRDPEVGAATGNRWYMPEQASWGALVRYNWNAAAVVQMYWYRIAWGGTLAIKTEVFRRSELRHRWANAFCEDTMMFRALRELGLRVEFVPSLMMVNRETCDLPGYFGWVKRQLLTARLYHPRWLAVLAHGISTTLLLGAGVGLMLAALVARDWAAFYWAGGGMGGYLAAMVLLLLSMEIPVRQLVLDRGEPTRWLGFWRALQLVAAIPLTQVVYPLALLSVLAVREVSWRGIRYRIGGPWAIRRLSYSPYLAEPERVESHHSL